MKIIIYSILFFFTKTNLSFSHGEDKLGPNKGYIKMPGYFHSEVVKISPFEIKVYLLDIEWKNPIVKKSEVNAFILKEKATCSVNRKDLYFLCKFKKHNLNNSGILKLITKRDEKLGNPVFYKLPLKLEKSFPKKHSIH